MQILTYTLTVFFQTNPDIARAYSNITFDQLFKNAQQLLMNPITESQKMMVLNRFMQYPQKGFGFYKKNKTVKKKRNVKKKQTVKKRRTIKKKRTVKK